MKRKYHRNPYRAGGTYHELFEYMKKNQVYTVEALKQVCINRLHLTEERAAQDVYIINSPREKSHNGSDPRGNSAAKGHLYYAEKLERKYVAGIRQPQYFRLRWREEPLEPKKREHNVETKHVVTKMEKVRRRDLVEA